MWIFKKLLDKIRGVDEWEFGMRLITWTFWAWKTKNTFQEVFLWKIQNPDWVVISNIPYKDVDWKNLVDISFNSKQDLKTLLEHLYRYLRDTNTFEYLQDSVFVPIKIIIDEAHLYYFSRDFKSFDMEMMTILTQCRKRLVSIYFITQELPQIDKFLRRLCPEVIVYTRWSLWLVYKNLMYFKSTERSDIADDYNVEMLSSRIVWRDWLRLFFNKDLQKFFDQQFLTYYICGAWDIYSLDYAWFFSFINNRRNQILDRLEWKNEDTISEDIPKDSEDNSI